MGDRVGGQDSHDTVPKPLLGHARPAITRAGTGATDLAQDNTPASITTRVNSTRSNDDLPRNTGAPQCGCHNPVPGPPLPPCGHTDRPGWWPTGRPDPTGPTWGRRHGHRSPSTNPPDNSDRHSATVLVPQQPHRPPEGGKIGQLYHRPILHLRRCPAPPTHRSRDARLSMCSRSGNPSPGSSTPNTLTSGKPTISSHTRIGSVSTGVLQLVGVQPPD